MARLVARLKACPDEELEFSHRLLQPLWSVMLWRSSKSATPLQSALTKNAYVNPLECASMRHAPVSISFSTRDLLSFFSFRAHPLGGGTRPPERTRLNSAVRHQLGSSFVLTWGSTD